MASMSAAGRLWSVLSTVRVWDPWVAWIFQPWGAVMSTVRSSPRPMQRAVTSSGLGVVISVSEWAFPQPMTMLPRSVLVSVTIAPLVEVVTDAASRAWSLPQPASATAAVRAAAAAAVRVRAVRELVIREVLSSVAGQLKTSTNHLPSIFFVVTVWVMRCAPSGRSSDRSTR